MMATQPWSSMRSSILRGAIGVAVFLLAGVVELAISPDRVPNGPFPFYLLALATVAMFVVWKMALRWSFFPEDEPRVILEETAVGDSQILAATFAEQVAMVHVPAVAVAAFMLSCAAPAAGLRPPLPNRSSTNVTTIRIAL